MKVIAFCNHKGGVGKTTSTASVGVAMARLGKRVLLVDLDGQANLTGIFIQQDVEKSIFACMTERIAPALPVINIEKNNQEEVSITTVEVVVMEVTEIAVTEITTETTVEEVVGKK